MTIGERIKLVRKSLHMTQTEFASKIGSVQNTVTGYENGRRNPSSPVISLICERFGVNENWLRTGEGEMMLINSPSELDMLARKYDLQHKDYVMIQSLLKMSPEGRAGVFRFMQEVVAASGDDPFKPELPREAKNVHDWTPDEMRAELERQLAAEEADREKGTINVDGGSRNGSAADCG